MAKQRRGDDGLFQIHDHHLPVHHLTIETRQAARPGWLSCLGRCGQRAGSRTPKRVTGRTATDVQ